MDNLQYEKKTDFLKEKFDPRAIPEIEVIEIELFNVLSDSKGVVRDMCSQILNAGGKRIRPLLVLYSGLVFSPVSSELINAAVASELIHMASLVHDDIIDNSSLRRSKPSINSSWGNHFAVLCGDYLFAKAFGVLSKNRLIGSMDLMVEAIENMCEGEILQAHNKFNFGTDLDMYYSCISRKTAIFLECCCKSGALVSGASENQLDAIGKYGLNMGLAFQIIDDILDICGNTKVTGKPNFEDLRQGNITLPLIMLLKDENYAEFIKEIVHSRSFSDHTLKELTKILENTGIISRCYETALMHIEKAIESLMNLPKSEYTYRLNNLANMLMMRAN
ncbi:MAG: polyprenyl synthetase family protein [Bacillota bacterium]